MSDDIDNIQNEPEPMSLEDQLAAALRALVSSESLVAEQAVRIETAIAERDATAAKLVESLAEVEKQKKSIELLKLTDTAQEAEISKLRKDVVAITHQRDVYKTSFERQVTLRRKDYDRRKDVWLSDQPAPAAPTDDVNPDSVSAELSAQPTNG